MHYFSHYFFDRRSINLYLYAPSFHSLYRDDHRSNTVFILFPLLCGSYTSSADSLFLISSVTNSVQPSSLRSSSLPSLLYFHSHHPPSYVVLLSSHHMPIPLHPHFLDFLCCDFPHFRCPPYSFISCLVQLRNSAHPS